MTLWEIDAIQAVMRERDRREDLYTARVVAMIAAVNSKKQRYDPLKWMIDGQELKRERAAERAAGLRAKGPMHGDDMLRQMQSLGMPVIDLRGKVPPIQVVIQ